MLKFNNYLILSLFSLIFILVSCSSPTETPIGSLSGTVHLEHETDHSEITVALYDLAILDPTIVSINQGYPQIGVHISQHTEFDHRLQSPVKFTQTEADGSFMLEEIPTDIYNIVTIKDGLGFRYLYEVVINEGDNDLPSQPEIFGETIISEYFDEQNNYFLTDNHCIIEDDTELLPNQYLEIQPGSMIRINPGVDLTIHGALKSQGEENNMFWVTNNIFDWTMGCTILLYIDPGTGSLLISVLIALALSVLYFVKGIFYKISYLFFGAGGNTVSDFSGKIVFFTEGKAYWRVFKPVVLELINSKQNFVYLSADKDDEGLSITSEYVEAHYIGNIRQAIFILNRLKAKMCVMTTPQIDVIALKRSKYIEHYCHIIHSPTDIHAYKKFAFDYFDSILCSSKSQIDNLKFLEVERKSKPKQLFQTGCTYYDVLLSDTENRGDSILLAPTWGDRTFLKSCGKEIVRKLLEGGHKVIFRPHPQSWISDKELLNDIVTSFGSNVNLTIDKETRGEKAISQSKLLICDITSGMLFDMAFVYKKPVVAIRFDWKDGGYESSSLLKETAAIDLLKDVGDVVNVEDVKDISAIVDESSSKTITQEIIDKHIFNFQEAGKVAAEQIISIYRSIN